MDVKRMRPAQALRAGLGLAALAASMAVPAAEPAAAQPAAKPATIAEAFAAGKTQISARYRFEQVEEKAFAEDAHASTLRLRLGYETAAWDGLSMLVELDHVESAGGDAYYSTRNGRTDRPTVADPEGTDLNQALLKWAGTAEELVLGRQRLNLDNQRFVGGVGWRQNEQTFDAATLRSKRISRATLSYSFIDNVNRVFGPQPGTPPGNLHGETHFLNAAIDLKKAGKLSGFGYLLDFDNAATLSSKTFGALWTGQYPVGKLKLPWSLSYASQSDYADNPLDVSASYWQAEVGLARDKWSAKIGREVLTGELAPTGPNRAFQTPLATLHLWQGWADKFLTTPQQGIEDTYVALGAKLAGCDLQLAWHDFGAEAVNRDYGTEWNASIGRKFANRVDVLLKAAHYDADTFSTDTTKLWVMATVAFP